MSSGSIYSASDKALFDAINQASVTASDLRELFLRHGIVISKSTSRRQLAFHFARLMHDFYDFETLAKIFETPQRRERLSSMRFAGGLAMSDVEGAAHSVVAGLLDQNDSASVVVQPDGTVKINVRYKRLHFNKSEFKQIETKEAVITVEKEGDTFVVRGPQNDKVDEICSELIGYLEEQSGKDIDLDRIELSSYSTSANRVAFFRYLIDHVPGYKRSDVTDVYLFNPNKSRSAIDVISDDVGDGLVREEDLDLGIHISSASLKGGQVLESSELRAFFSRGFYISKIVWRAVEEGFDSDITEFEAQFTEPETCTHFSYLVRGYYEYLGNSEYSKHRKQLGSATDREIGKLIEASARSAIKSLSEKK